MGRIGPEARGTYVVAVKIIGLNGSANEHLSYSNVSVTDKNTPSLHKLSADAKEFIPASVRSTHVNAEPAFPPAQFHDSSYAVAIFRSYIEDLMQEPGMYNATIAELEQNLACCVYDEATASKLAEELIQHVSHQHSGSTDISRILKTL